MLFGHNMFHVDGEVCLYSLCVLLLTHFLKVGLFFSLWACWSLRSYVFYEFHLKIILTTPPHLSPLINTWNEAWMGWFCFLLSLLCFFCSSPVLGIHTYLASDLPFSSEGEGYCSRLVLNPWVWKTGVEYLTGSSCFDWNIFKGNQMKEMILYYTFSGPSDGVCFCGFYLYVPLRWDGSKLERIEHGMWRRLGNWTSTHGNWQCRYHFSYGLVCCMK